VAFYRVSGNPSSSLILVLVGHHLFLIFDPQLHQCVGVLTPKFGKSANLALYSPICQNYVEINLYGQDSQSDRAKDEKCTKLHVHEP
jgi:hypothetical protein